MLRLILTLGSIGLFSARIGLIGFFGFISSVWKLFGLLVLM